MKKFLAIVITSAVLVLLSQRAEAIQILVDYTYDTNNFFNTQQKRDAMQAAADRWAGIIDSELQAFDANYAGGTAHWRVGFSHPGTGSSFQISTAASSGSDNIVGAGGPEADVYDPSFALPLDTWILFAGGRSMGSAGTGGTGTGVNFTTTLDDPNGPLKRGLGVIELPVWGGSVAFNSGITWHFDLATAAPSGSVDFYSIALHEVGHALGLNIGWADFLNHTSGDQYFGPNALAALNADNGTSASSLSLVSSSNPHWADNVHKSFIFEPAAPNFVGTVGSGVLQDLLMDPVANFVFPSIRRLEVTNVEAGELQDIGWSIVPEPSAYVLALVALCALGMVAWRRRALCPVPVAAGTTGGRR